MSFDSHNLPKQPDSLFFQVFKEGNGGCERLSIAHKITQLLSDTVKIPTPFSCTTKAMLNSHPVNSK